jgi:protein tyrosine phosphatase
VADALIYDALLEYVQSDQTEVYVATFDEYVDGLAKDNGLGFRQQHALINCDTAGPDTSATFEYANEPYNKPKNRSPQFLPTDVYSHRVSISMKPGVPGSDYINASFLPSYRHLKQFIITQYPLEETISAFWQMIWLVKT